MPTTEPRYFVYFDYGDCNSGDHDNGWNSFDTLAEAEAFATAIQRDKGHLSPTIVILEGRVVEVLL